MGRRDWSAISFQCIHSKKMPFRDQSPIFDFRNNDTQLHRRGSLINLPFERERKKEEEEKIVLMDG